MGDKEFNGDKEEQVFWWEDYDGDIEEEKRKIEELISKIEDPEESEARYEQLLNALEYDEYFAYNPHFKCESYLSILRRYNLERHEDKDIDEFIDLILRYTNMKHTPWSHTQNILIVNDNRKFTFLNPNNLNTRNNPNLTEILEKGKTKLPREYKDEWVEEDDDETRFTIEWVRLCKWGEDD